MSDPIEMTDEKKDAAQREMEILTAWALRFDGYAYEAATGFVLADGSTAWADHGRLPDDPLARLAILFALQRWLGKWGGEYEPLHGRTWRRFRELFLLTHAVRVPREYRFGHWYEDWKRERLPRAAEDVSLAERIHAETKYDDDAKPPL